MTGFDLIFSKRSLMVWLALFFSPTIYIGLLTAFTFGDFKNKILSLLIYLVPCISFVICVSTTLFSKAAISQKVAWIFFTLFAMAFQLIALVLAIFFFNGFEGIQ